MKRLIILLSFICLMQAKAQTYVLIPDANFAACLQFRVPSAMSGNSLNITSTLVTTATQTMSVGGATISNLSGIQYFTSLTYIDCNNNSLISLPPLPNSLTYLNCEINSLTTLPALPNSLQTLYCQGNSLTTLPALPNSLQTLNCFQNNIACFPVFPSSITSVFLANNPFTCLPNIVLPAMHAYTIFPLCTPGNTNGCTFVGIKELSVGSNDISLYPNPANDMLYLSSDANEFTKAEIINSLGQLAAEADLNHSNKKAAINIKDLPNGVYSLILRVQSSNDNPQTVSKRFVVAR